MSVWRSRRESTHSPTLSNKLHLRWLALLLTVWWKSTTVLLLPRSETYNLLRRWITLHLMPQPGTLTRTSRDLKLQKHKADSGSRPGHVSFWITYKSFALNASGCWIIIGILQPLMTNMQSHGWRQGWLSWYINIETYLLLFLILKNARWFSHETISGCRTGQCYIF